MENISRNSIIYCFYGIFYHYWHSFQIFHPEFHLNQFNWQLPYRLFDSTAVRTAAFAPKLAILAHNSWQHWLQLTRLGSVVLILSAAQRGLGQQHLLQFCAKFAFVVVVAAAAAAICCSWLKMHLLRFGIAAAANVGKVRSLTFTLAAHNMHVHASTCCPVCLCVFVSVCVSVCNFRT